MRLPYLTFSALLALSALAVCGRSAQAQTVQEFENAMSGTWTVSPGPASGDKACALVLTKTAGHHGKAIASNDCHGVLGAAAEWGIAQSQLAFFNADGKVVAALGGNQNHLTGNTAEKQPIDMVRPSAPTAENTKVQAPSPTSTQSQLETAISGEWIVQNAGGSGGTATCRLNLKLQGSSNQYAVENTGCSGELAEAVGWSIDQGKLALRNSKGENFVLLGGNEARLSGKSNAGNTIVLVRANPPPVVPVVPRVAGRCVYYLGYTATCASPSELAPPSIPAKGSTSVAVLVKLNLRIRPALSAPIVRVIPPNTCVKTDKCQRFSDGVWCHAEIAGRDGWIKKDVVRLRHWHVVTFANGCSGGHR